MYFGLQCQLNNCWIAEMREEIQLLSPPSLNRMRIADV